MIADAMVPQIKDEDDADVKQEADEPDGQIIPSIEEWPTKCVRDFTKVEVRIRLSSTKISNTVLDNVQGGVHRVRRPLGWRVD